MADWDDGYVSEVLSQISVMRRFAERLAAMVSGGGGRR
jgi:hypothetical protein